MTFNLLTKTRQFYKQHLFQHESAVVKKSRVIKCNLICPFTSCKWILGIVLMSEKGGKRPNALGAWWIVLSILNVFSIFTTKRWSKIDLFFSAGDTVCILALTIYILAPFFRGWLEHFCHCVCIMRLTHRCFEAAQAQNSLQGDWNQTYFWHDNKTLHKGKIKSTS